MDMVKKIGDTIFNVFYYKVALMFFLIPTLLVYCVSFNYKLLFVMLGWGALICAYDFIIRRRFVHARGMLWLIAFMVCFALSVVINFRTGLNLNLSNWAYTAIALLVLYPDSFDKTKERNLKELSILNNIFLGMTTVFSTISLGMYVVLYHYAFEYGDQKYYVGWANNRLFGIYASTGYMITAIALAVAVIQVAVYKSAGKKMKTPYKAFIIITSVLNFFSMCLENAKGAYISLAAFAVIATFFYCGRALIKKGWNEVKVNVVSVVAAGLAAVILIGAIYITRPVLSYIPAIYKNVTETVGPENPDEEKEEDMEKVEIDRDIPESYGFFTGRTIIWKFGLQEFMEKPIFGHGPNSHRDIFIVDNYLRHFHNVIVQTLVSVGAVGSVFIFGFFLIAFLFILKHLFKQKKEGSPYYAVAVALFAFLGMLLVNGMAEVTILFITRFAMFMFWMYLGYIQTFFDDDKKGKGTLFLENMDEKLKKVFKQK